MLLLNVGRDAALNPRVSGSLQIFGDLYYDPDFLVRRGNSGNPKSTICPFHQLLMEGHYYLT